MVLKAPLKLPTGVLAAETITMSSIMVVLPYAVRTVTCNMLPLRGEV
jgi:hypothetical protein